MWFFYFLFMDKKRSLKIILHLCLLIFILEGCSRFKAPLFKKLSIDSTNIDFINSIKESDTFNILTNEYIFNGGGVAVADFDNNDLPDLFFTGNQVSNRLYLNQGNLKFRDVTSEANLINPERWSTGIAVGDVNADGWMDVYVCAAMNEGKRSNMLYINQGLTVNGIPKFLNQAQEYGLADISNSMAASFLDYNKDGLMDLFVVNNEQNDMLPTNYRKKIIDGSAASTDRLFKNNGDGTFTDVSKVSGILIEGFGLSVSISDFNNDSWPDIYITNDYLTNDILYINQQDGSFENLISNYTPCQSKFSMGSDIGDFNNDGFLDLITLDMLGETNQRKKTTVSKSSHIQEELNKRWGYENQHMRNMLFMGNNSSRPFSEIGQFSGIYQTDWSWSPLFMDVDNDGLKDLLITNGFPRDITDKDFANYRFEFRRYLSKSKLLDSIPVVKIPNYSYRNKGDLTFEKQEDNWGLNIPSFSNGAVYSDLDLDGDLDYVVNNINDSAFVFENTTDVDTYNFIQFELIGPNENPLALGSKVVIRFEDNSFQFHEQYLSKGYMSSVDHIVHFGLIKGKKIISVEVLWPDGNYTILKDLINNNRYKIQYDKSNKSDLANIEFPLKKMDSSIVYKESALKYGINYNHEEDEINDFEYDRLLPRKLTKNGPCIAVGDLNGDGMEDFIVGSSTGNSPVLFYQTTDNSFRKVNLFTNDNDKDNEVESIALFDLENDGDLDMYLVSGGGEFLPSSTNYEDRLLINDGNGNFSIKVDFDSRRSNGSIVIAEDYNLDGYVDLFVGARNKPGSYPFGDKSFIIKNDKGVLTQIDFTTFSENEEIGMVSDAIWVDIDDDMYKDLIIVGEYSSIQIFYNKKGTLKRLKNDMLDSVRGLWRCIEVFDNDQDGDNDFIIGNIGTNNMYNISENTPLELIAIDIDKNGSIDPLIFTFQESTEGEMESYPIQFWNNLNQQSPFFRKRFNTFREFSQSTKNDFLSDTIFDTAKTYTVNQDKSIMLENLGNNKFNVIPLNSEVQLAPINDVLVDQKGQINETIFMIGNDYGGSPFEGNKEALRGLILETKINTSDLEIHKNSKGFEVAGNAKAINSIKLSNGVELILVTQNQDQLLVFEKKP